MQTKIITLSEEFYSLKEDWERLQEQDPDVTYYSTFQFNKTWWDIYKDVDKLSLATICVYNNGIVVGIAPLIIEKRNKKILSYNVLKFMGGGDFLGFIMDKSSNNEFTIVKEIFSVIEHIINKWGKVELYHLPQNSTLAWYLLKNAKYNELTQYLTECPRINIEKISNFEEYKEKFIPSKTSTLRNKLQKEVGYIFKVVNNKFDYDTYNDISKTHKEEQEYLYKSKGKKDNASIFNDFNQERFLKSLFRDNENIITFILEDSKHNIITYSNCYLYKRVLYSWNTGYDPKYAKYTLGKVRMYEITRYLIEKKLVDSLDWGAGRYCWKFEWTNEFIYDYQFNMWNLKSKKVKLINILKSIKTRIS